MQDIRKEIRKLIDKETDTELLFNIYLVLLMRGKGICRMGDCCRKQKYLC